MMGVQFLTSPGLSTEKGGQLSGVAYTVWGTGNLKAPPFLHHRTEAKQVGAGGL